MKTIFAGNANAFLKNQINNIEREIHSTPVINLTQNWQVSDCLKPFHN